MDRAKAIGIGVLVGIFWGIALHSHLIGIALGSITGIALCIRGTRES